MRQVSENESIEKLARETRQDFRDRLEDLPTHTTLEIDQEIQRVLDALNELEEA